MKRIFIFFIIGIGISYLVLVCQKQSIQTIFSLQPKVPIAHFNLDQAPRETLRGSVEALTGEVNWISRIATTESRLDKNILLQQGEEVMTGLNGMVQIDFADKTYISIADKSHVQIIQTLPTSVMFKQVQGQVNYIGDIPTSVRAFHLLVVLYSGEMSIDADPETGKVIVSAIQGSAKVGYNDLDYVSHTLELQKGQIYEFDDTNRTGLLQESKGL